MKHNSMRWSRTIMAVIIVICLALGRQTVTYVKSADNNTTKSKIVKLDEKLGVRPGAVLAELKAHESDGYYLGTPYDSTPLTPENCMRPNGAYGGAGGMNCTGFVAYVLEKCGADLSGIASRGYRGGKVNASNWYHWLTENSVEYYHYSTVEELLAGKRAQKGDVIYFEPISWESAGADCHIGFFWGNHAGENLFWNSSAKPENGNQISQLISKSPSTVYLFKITHTGDVEVKKGSDSEAITNGNRCYSLGGAEYTLYQSGTGKVAAVIRTDENGYGKAANLEEGSYDIVETKAPEGYVLDGQKQRITVEPGSTVIYECKDRAVYSSVELLLEKTDAQTKEKKPQGAASFLGAEFTVRYYDVISETDPAEAKREPLRTWVFAADEKGEVYFSKEYLIGGEELYFEDGKAVLPIGTVTIVETKAPEGYRASEQTYVKCIRDDGEGGTEELQVYQKAEIAQQVIRGDLELVKAADGTLERMAGIPFRLTSRTTGESHIIVTDKNGYASTSADWNPHTQNTNEGKSSSDGVWFGEGEADDGAGALIYDTYIVEELECENNDDRILIPPFEVEISREKYTVNLGTLTNDARPLPEIATTARDKNSQTHVGESRKEAVIVDKVSWKNLIPGREYTVRGVLMDAVSGEPFIQNNDVILADKIFTADTPDGSVELEFCFDASKLNGTSLVVFERLYLGEDEVASHADLSDKEQTVSYEKKIVENPGPKASEVTSVKTGDEANLIVLILCAFLSCTIILRYVIMSAEQKD